MPDNHDFSQIIQAMASGFKKEAEVKNLKRLQELGESPLKAFEQALVALGEGDLGGIPLIQDVLSFHNSILRDVVANEFPEKTAAELDVLAFFLSNFNDIEDAATRWFSTLEGGACSADKGRALCKMLWMFLAYGKDPRPNYQQKYTYHLSSGSLIHSHENIAWLQNFKSLLNGQFMDYMRFMAICKDKMESRYDNPDVADEHCIPFDPPQGEKAYDVEHFSSLPHIQLLASLKKHRPHWDSLSERAHILRYAADFEELKPMMTRKQYQKLHVALTGWALRDEKFPTKLRGWPVRFFPTAEILLRFLTHRSRSSLGVSSEYKAIMENYRSLNKIKRKAT